jgi:putative DNA primase/helicase
MASDDVERSDRTYLAVPYDEKDEAEALGAKWDAREKAWYVPAGADLDAFRSWLPVTDSPVAIETDGDPREEFAAALRHCGLIVEGPAKMDGKLYRVRVQGEKGPARSGAYVGHLEPGRPVSSRLALHNEQVCSDQLAFSVSTG